MKPLSLLLLLLWPLHSFGQNAFDWTGREHDDEDVFKEQQVALPALPSASDLIEFEPEFKTSLKYFVDGRTVAVGEDGVVRYTMVVKGEGNATNVSYEGIRCAEGEFKTYAFGGADGAWMPVRKPQWKPVRPDAARRSLSRDIFCPQNAVIGSSREAVRALRAGYHPESQRAYTR